MIHAMHPGVVQKQHKATKYKCKEIHPGVVQFGCAKDCV